MNIIDSFLNKFTMYRSVLYGLLLLSILSLILSVFGFLHFNPLNLIFSFSFLIAVCYLSNKLFARILNVPTNTESFFITALILFLILTPINSLSSIGVFFIAGVIAMGSKYIIVIHKRHIFNPAAFSLVVLGVLGFSQGEWWVSNIYMFPMLLIVGLLIVRKVRRFYLFFSCIIFSLFAISVFALINHSDLTLLLPQVITSWPLIFLATIMLTEPLTTPPSKNLQIVYGAIVGILSGSQFSFGPIFSTSELALIIGNIFSYAVSFKYRFVFNYLQKIQVSSSTYEFIFTNKNKFDFLPGQYLEWTLGHKNVDSRGNRRFFTIASSPTEKDIRLGIRIDPAGFSSFKKKLLSLKDNDLIIGGNLSGDFTLPKKPDKKLVFIAGGIGITPFRSMIKYLLDKNEKRNIINFYSNKVIEDIMYKDVFDKADENLGIKTVYNLTDVDNIPKNWKGKRGRIDQEIIADEVPDFKERTFYLSGPHNMVSGYEQVLGRMGVKPMNIIKDFFPGYA